MESLIIIILAVLALVLTGALVAAMRRGSTGRETLDPRVLDWNVPSAASTGSDNREAWL